jgi:hypothetical protein
LSGVISGRNAARHAGLWALLAGLGLLAALSITAPRIFRDEVLHWQMARVFAAHEPLLFFGKAIDYLAVLYPAVGIARAHGATQEGATTALRTGQP